MTTTGFSRKILTILMVCVLCLSFTACGGKDYYKEVKKGTQEVPFTDVKIGDGKGTVSVKMSGYTAEDKIKNTLFYRDYEFAGQKGILFVRFSENTGNVSEVFWSGENVSEDFFQDIVKQTESYHKVKPFEELSSDDAEMKERWYNLKMENGEPVDFISILYFPGSGKFTYSRGSEL